MTEGDRLFKRYCNENNPTLKAAKLKKYKNARNTIIFKFKQLKKRILSELISKAVKNF